MCDKKYETLTLTVLKLRVLAYIGISILNKLYNFDLYVFLYYTVYMVVHIQ